MSDDGFRLQLRGTVFKFELLQIIGGVVEATAKTILAIKTGGAIATVAPNFITGMFSALKGVKLDETPELRAWILVSGGLLYALEKSISETKLSDVPPPEAVKRLLDDIGVRVETRTYFVEPDFFSSPNSLELLDDAAHELSAWGSQFGGIETPKEAKARILRYFPTGLHRVWMKDVRRFESLEQSLNSPFTAAMKVQRELDGYLQYIEEQFTEQRLIGQDEDDPRSVKLAQVFVPLRAYFETNAQNEKAVGKQTQDSPAEYNVAGRALRNIVRFFEALDEWVGSTDRRDPIRVISGGPGIGKSSSMRAYAAHIARSGVAFPIFIPLQKLGNPDRPLRDRIREYLVSTKDIPFTVSPFELADGYPMKKSVLLIFDGLDELVRPGKDADEIAREFMVDVRGLLDQENGTQGASPARLVAVITGRVAAASSAARALKCSGKQVLFLLRFEESYLAGRESAKDPANLLAEDQRRTWWNLWRSTGQNVPTEVPEALLHVDLREVTIEPLLLYFVALIRPWESDLGKGGMVRNRLYGRLLRHFFDRECGKGDLNFATEFQTFDDYEIVLQAMALAAWYDGSTRIGTIETVEKLLRDWDPHVATSFKNVIGSSKPEISAALSFYMRAGERPNSFEFLHKTFAEYLVTRRIVEATKIIAEDFEASRSGQGSRRKSFDPPTHLENWLRLAGPRSIDFDLLRFLQDELAILHVETPSTVKSWREALAFCLRSNLSEGMPAHILFQLRDDQLVRRPQTFREASDQARNAEETMLAVLNSAIVPWLVDADFAPIDIRPYPNDSAVMGTMIQRLRGQRMDPAPLLSITLFSGLCLSKERLFLQDLYGLVARGADFSSAQFYSTNFETSDLTGANFSHAIVENSYFRGSTLTQVNFNNARLLDSDFTEAQLDGATFVDADRRDKKIVQAKK